MESGLICSKIVFANIVGGMRSIVDVMDEQGMEVGRENRHHIDLVDREPPINTGQAFPGNYQNALQRLWDDEGVRECWARAYEYALPENMP